LRVAIGGLPQHYCPRKQAKTGLAFCIGAWPFSLGGGENKTLTFENIPLSALIIRKTDSETGQPVSGASFTVKYLAGTSGRGGTTIFEGVTSINGTIILTALDVGTYVVEETASVPGYELSNPAVQKAFISGEDQDVITLTFSNARMGGLVIKKLDSVTKQPVKDVTFKVMDSSGGVIGPDNGEYITDAEGLINIAEPLPIGSTVIVQEIRCPDNYVIDTTEQSVKIKENTLHTLTFYNTPKSGLLITKYDSVSRKTLPGTVFRVTDSEGKAIGNSNGRLTRSDAHNGYVQSEAVLPRFVQDAARRLEDARVESAHDEQLFVQLVGRRARARAR
jgi:uncharacterized surface anchored protein